MTSLADLGEFGLIARLVEGMPAGRGVILGVGDDAAVVETTGAPLLLTVDMLVEGRHFVRAADPVALGYKTLAVNVSDIAAMGGIPAHALLAISLPPETEVAWVDGLRAGLAEAAARYGVALVGGDTTSGDRIVLSLTLTGVPAAGRVLTRGGAQAGDVICVTSTLGDAEGGLRVTLAAMAGAGPAAAEAQTAATFGDAEAALLRAHERPVARVGEGQAAARGGAHAMIDVSDGLLADLGHICEHSGVAAEVDAAAVPISAALRTVAARLGFDPLAAALSGGEDFELLMTVAATDFAALRAAVAAAGSPLTPIGRIVAGSGVRLIGAEAPPAAGWDHFRAAARA